MVKGSMILQSLVTIDPPSHYFNPLTAKYTLPPMNHAEKMQAYSQKLRDSYLSLLEGNIEASNSLFSEVKPIWLSLVSDDNELAYPEA